jgi:hypothetical protein
MMGCWRRVEIAFWPVSVIVLLLTEPVSRAPPMLVIELAVEPRRMLPFAALYCRWDTSGKGNCVVGDVGEESCCGLGLPGEAIWTVLGMDVGNASAVDVGSYVQWNGWIKDYWVQQPSRGHDCVRRSD